MAEIEYLIVGLGNPGREYRLNRHNAGFLALDQMVGRWGLPAFTRKQSNALFTSGAVDGRRVVLAKPQTYMNLSGASVASLLRFYKLEVERLLVCVDDLNLPFGTLRLRPRGTAGGQRGLQSIIAHLNSDRFPRLRIGIGAPPGQMPHAAYVLQDFHEDELDLLDATLDRCVELSATWMSQGVELAMSKHNGPGEDGGQKAGDTT
jgi:PTH1 family peptidyl-tRNA hydrolase